MHKTRLKANSVTILVTAATLLLVSTLPSMAVDKKPEPKPVQKTKQPGPRNYGVDDSGEPLKRLEPLKPRTKEKQQKIDSVAWYMTGQLKERRNDLSGALTAFQKAVELDPAAAQIYQALVPLAFRLNQVDLGVKYALQAAELDSDQNHRWLRQISARLVELRRFPQAINFLEKAKQSKSLKKGTIDYVMIHRDLAILHSVLRHKERAADAFEIVFDALVNHEKSQLGPGLRERMEQDPLTTYERIGNIFLAAKRTELAIKAYEMAQKTGQGEPGNLGFNLAQVYFQTKQHEKALAQLQKYFDAQLTSKGTEAYKLLSEILKALDRSDELIRRLVELADKDLRNTNLQFYLAEQFLENDQLDDAEAYFKHGLESGNPAGYAGLAHVYRRQNKPEKLLEAMSNAIKNARDASQLAQSLVRLHKEMLEIGKDPKLLKTLLELGRANARKDPPTLEFPTSLILAKLAANAENVDAASEFYRTALELSGKKSGLVYEDFGQLLLDSERYSEAVTLFEEAVKNPAARQGKPHYLYRLSMAHELNKNTKTALETLSEAREILKNRGVLQVPLFDYHESWIFYHSQQWDQAIQSFEKYISTYSGKPRQRDMIRRCRSILSNIYVQNGEMRKGEEVLEKILAEDPDDPSVNNDLGYLYADQGKNLEQAEKMIRKAVKAQPKNAAYLDSLGWVLFKLNRIEEAATQLEQASALPEGQDSTIYDHLADCYQKLNKSQKAVEAWKKALKLEKASTSPDKKIIEKIELKLKDKPKQ